ncbi:VTT domain-containing protein [Candidatus Peregrinibacteria bacterium]|nr:VTT domain-containing protein [Candidatus Peregrinibacteria bacterium]
MFDIITLIKTAGYLGIAGILFAESGLFVGFFLPGDSLLFTAGFLASQGYLHIVTLMILSFVAAVAGDSVGYAFGRRVGPAIFKREDSLLFHKNHIERARIFYERHGGKAIILARFMPIVRTFAPILAGVGRMRYSMFVAYNIVGGFLWTIGLSGLGYFLGNTIPDIDKYLLPIILVIIFFSVAPSAYHVLKNASAREHIRLYLKRVFKNRKTP